MLKKFLIAALLLMPSVAMAQTAGQSITGFLLNQGSTYNGYTCPSSQVYPCFVQYGDTVPVTGEISGIVTVDQGDPNGGGVASWPVIANPSVGITPTDRTITSATGASQQVMAANTSRKGLLIQNTGSSNCGINPTGGTAVIGGAGTITLFPGGSYSPRIPTLSAVTAICTAAQPLYADEN